MDFLIVNGKVCGISEVVLNSFCLNSVKKLNQKVWYGYGGIPFFNENIEQLKKQAEALKIPFPPEFKNRRELFRLTKRMLNKNKFYRSGYITFQIFQNENSIQTLVLSNAFQEFDFPFDSNGLLADFSVQKKQLNNPFSVFPVYNEQLWQAGLAEINETPFQQIIFTNTENSVCEGIHANIFMIKENNLYTPDLSSGCYEDVLRKVIIDFAKDVGLNTFEKINFEKNEIFEMDEVFFVSESNEFKWVLGIENKRFFLNYSKKIYDLLIRKLNTNS